MDRRTLMYLSRELRQQSTWAEQRAWEILRSRRCLGFKFRRQFPYRGFVLDVFCRELALNVEIDGTVHDEPANRAHDEARDELLAAYGLRILRIRNEDVSSERVTDLVSQVPPLRVCGEGDRG